MSHILFAILSKKSNLNSNLQYINISSLYKFKAIIYVIIFKCFFLKWRKTQNQIYLNPSAFQLSNKLKTYKI